MTANFIKKLICFFDHHLINEWIKIGFYIINWKLLDWRLSMLPLNDLKKTLKMLVKGSTDLILYGHKSWDRTKLVKQLLNKVLGENTYLSINCTIIQDRNAFLFLINNQLMRVISHFDSKYVQKQSAKTLPIKIEISEESKEHQFHQSLDQWIKMMNNLIQEYPAMFEKITRLYLLVDNVEECVSSKFISSFYKACKQELVGISFSFFFCGSSLKNKEFHHQYPFKSIISFFMPKPSLKEAIKEGNREGFGPIEIGPEHKKLNEEIIIHLTNKLDPIEMDLNIAREVSKQLTIYLLQYFKRDFTKLDEFIRLEKMDEISKDLIENGPIYVPNVQKELIKEQGMCFNEIMTGVTHFQYEKYPSLIMSSLYLANGYPEFEDRRRFLEYIERKTKTAKSKVVANNQFKKNQSICRHATQRIIAISQSLEDQSAKFDGDQSELPHHTLDYYGCFEYLRDEGKMDYYGKTSKKFWGKLVGDAKECEVRGFFKKMELKISQFTDKDDL